MSRESNAPNKPIRWWPAAIIVGAILATQVTGTDGTEHALWQPYIDFFAGK